MAAAPQRRTPTVTIPRTSRPVDPAFTHGTVGDQFANALKGSDRDAYLALNALFRSYGLASLAPKIYDYIKNGYAGDTITLLLQDTPEYKQRFAGNEVRRKAGLPVLPPNEYLATESSYRQIMRSAGLPKGFYDNPDDFKNWIGGDVSPSEVQNRVDLATQATTLANPQYKAALKQMGIDDAHLVAHFLDQKKALPFLQKQAATAAIGAEALRSGLKFSQSYAGQLATMGVSAQEARQGYSQISQELGTLQGLASVYGDEYTQRQAEEATFQGEASAVEARQRIIGEEKAQFSGSAGGARAGLAQQGGAR